MTSPQTSRRSAQRPHGLAEGDGEVGRFARWRAPLATLAFLVVLGAAMLGWLGGGPDTVLRTETPLASLRVTHAAILRSGNWFETLVEVTPRRAVGDLVVAIDAPLWRGMSIDTLAPDAESATSLDGRMSYHFGKVAAGQRFELKLDGQIQPRALRRLSGAVRAFDGSRPLAAIPLTLTVMP